MSKARKPAKKKIKSKEQKFYILNLKIRSVANSSDISPQDYSDFFVEFYRAEIRSRSSKMKEGMLITMAEQVMVAGPGLMYGQFVEFTNLDNMRWFDVLKKAIDNTFSVPENFKANVHKSDYYFFPTIHRFAYLLAPGNQINPYNVRQFLTNSFQLFFDKNYPGQYLVQIDVETESSVINRILRASKIFSLSMKINYSNADIGKRVKQFVEDDLKPTNLQEIDISVKSKKGSDIDISKSKILKGGLYLAQSNGTAEAVIENENGKREQIKTEAHPRKVVIAVPEVEPVRSIYSYFARMFKNGN